MSELCPACTRRAEDCTSWAEEYTRRAEDCTDPTHQENPS